MTIQLYTWGTPNGRKVSIALEELGLPYEVHPVDITKDQQFDPAFLKISPNNKIPAIIDPEGPGGQPIALFESGAILVWLADKTGRLLAKEGVARYQALQWLMWQMGGFGPMLGQAHHFLRFAKEEVPYARDRYSNETRRLYGVLDRRLAEADFLGGADYSIADIATYPWAARHEWQRVELAEFPNVKRWYDGLTARPAVAKGMQVP
ncbi:GST-like protein [Tistlia consotensis]|uniref:GST-like protein n=1 Tax=Tistlia consotensis USBA 355 TaxID=560819 RepID=A0A1Y6CCZ1_9PROT|nr:glutathione S-transferase N-terminal domain-containing protein [Tistlia consotensis]SMF48366.1 GST-like protein [Tistlia consotensis USBA 355]SNR81347.1 GST-like protein [Tistlia consotensis]